MRLSLGRRRPKVYRLRHYREREHFRSDYLRLAAALLERLDFDSALDVGCGNGFLLEAFAAAGKEVAGVDPSPDVLRVVPDHLAGAVRIGDFTAAARRWDLVCCVEVAEHLPPERSEELVATLSRAARRWIYFTAAPPGQAGHGHINCRPLADWLVWFGAHGWAPCDAATAELRAALAALDQAVWLARNSVVLGRRDASGV